MIRGLILRFFVAIALVTLVSCGRETTRSRSPLPFGSVDLPLPRSTVQGSVQVAGWALADGPIGEVSVYLDRKFLTAASMKVARPDVASVQPNYKEAANCGFTTMVDSSTFAAGWHELVVQARTDDGVTRDLATVPVLVQR